jgi:DNA-binding NarL/FixJ family response regulator
MPPNMFTHREHEVIDALGSGLTTYRALAKKIGVGEKSIQAYLLNMYRLTGCDNMAGLVLWLVDHGYISSSRDRGD